MKTEKALKRLTRAEALLSRVLHQIADKHPQIRGLLDSAKASVGRAKKAIGLPAFAAEARSVKADEKPQRSLTKPVHKGKVPAAQKREAPKGVLAKKAADKAVVRKAVAKSLRRTAGKPAAGTSVSGTKTSAAREVAAPSRHQPGQGARRRVAAANANEALGTSSTAIEAQPGARSLESTLKQAGGAAEPN